MDAFIVNLNVGTSDFEALALLPLIDSSKDILERLENDPRELPGVGRT